MARKNEFKKERLEEKLLHGANQFFRTTLKDPRLQFVSCSRVELNNDSSVATIYWDTFDPKYKDDAHPAFESAKGKLRSHFAKALDRRTVPELKFVYDSQYEDEHRIEKLLKTNS